MFVTPAHWLTARIRIALIGCGGTGSALLDGLCALDVTLRQLGHPGFQIVCFDRDAVSAHVVGRQRFTHADVGLNKATLLAHRMGLFYRTDISAVPDHYGPRSRCSADLYITATDSAPLRAAFPSWHRHMRAVWADCGNGERGGQMIWGSLGTRPDEEGYLPNVLDLYPELSDSAFQASQADIPTCSAEESLRAQSFPVNRAVAGYAVDMLWQLIRHGSAPHNGVLFTVSPPSVSLIHANAASWAQFGWQAPATLKAKKQRAA